MEGQPVASRRRTEVKLSVLCSFQGTIRLARGYGWAKVRLRPVFYGLRLGQDWFYRVKLG